MGKLIATIGLALLVAAGLAPAASAKEQLLTLYSPRIDSLPYVHDTHNASRSSPTAAGARRAGLHPRLQGAGAGGLEGPDAKPLPIAKMMVHHFLYFAPGRVDEAPGGCWSGAGFIGGRGEEHPLGQPRS